MDNRVAAIRANKDVGNGSCSTWSECYSDDEIVQELDEMGIATPEAAVAHAIWAENLWRDRYNDINAEGDGGSFIPLIET